VLTRPRLTRPRADTTPAGIALRVAATVLLGILLATVAEYLFFVGDLAWLNLIVWAAVGVVIGAASLRWSTALWMDALLGFTLVLSYSIMGYQASAPLLGALLPFAAIALIGALGMAGAGAVGHALRGLGIASSPRGRGPHPHPAHPP
jgi:hypothetical protein